MKKRADPGAMVAARAALMERAHRDGLKLPEGIRDLRQCLGMTQQEFADGFRLTRRQVSELERGVANPTIDLLQRIGRAFNLQVGFVSGRRPTRER